MQSACGRGVGPRGALKRVVPATHIIHAAGERHATRNDYLPPRRAQRPLRTRARRLGEVGGAQPAERASTDGCQRPNATHCEGATSAESEGCCFTDSGASVLPSSWMYVATCGLFTPCNVSPGPLHQARKRFAEFGHLIGRTLQGVRILTVSQLLSEINDPAT